MPSTTPRWFLLIVLIQVAISPAWAQSNETEEDNQRIRRLGDLDPSVQEWRPGEIQIGVETDGLDSLRARAEAALAQGRLAGAEGAVVLWLEVLSRTAGTAGSGDSRARQALNEARERWLSTIDRHLLAADRSALLAEQQQLNELQNVDALNPVRQRLRRALTWLQQRPSLADTNTPENWQAAREVIALLTEQAGRLDWLEDDRQRLRQHMLDQWQQRENLPDAELQGWIRLAQQYRIELPQMETVVETLERAEIDRRLARIESALDNNALAIAAEQLADLPDSDPRYVDLESRLRRAQRVAQLEPGDVYPSLAGDLPEMVVVERRDDGSVLLAGRTEVTRAQYQAFLSATGAQSPTVESERYDLREGALVPDGLRAGQDYLGGDSQAGRHPVIHLRRQDAMAYIDWLNARSTITFRLPSAAEFVRYAGAGIAGRFWWGNGAPFQPLENLAGWDDLSPRRQLHSSAFNDYGDGAFGPAAVASYRPNPLGLFDTLGNVAEWSRDCAVNGNGDCRAYLALGPHWQSGPATEGKHASLTLAPDEGSSRVGVRVVADLRP